MLHLVARLVLLLPDERVVSVVQYRSKTIKDHPVSTHTYTQEELLVVAKAFRFVCYQVSLRIKEEATTTVRAYTRLASVPILQRNSIRYVSRDHHMWDDQLIVLRSGGTIFTGSVMRCDTRVIMSSANCTRHFFAWLPDIRSVLQATDRTNYLSISDYQAIFDFHRKWFQFQVDSLNADWVASLRSLSLSQMAVLKIDAGSFVIEWSSSRLHPFLPGGGIVGRSALVGLIDSE